MSITDRQRTELHKAAEESMGAQPADTMMALLPPVGWADVAMRHDLEREIGGLRREMVELETRIDLRFDGLEERMDGRFDGLAERMDGRFDGLEERLELKFEAKLERGLKDLSTRFFLGVVGLIAGLAAVAVTVAQLVG